MTLGCIQVHHEDVSVFFVTKPMFFSEHTRTKRNYVWVAYKGREPYVDGASLDY
jgi:hypothetical protein